MKTLPEHLFLSDTDGASYANGESKRVHLDRDQLFKDSVEAIKGKLSDEN